MDRQTRHDMKHDKFVDEVNLVASMAQENMRKVIGVFVAIGVIVIGVTAFLMYSRSVERKAQARLSEAIDTFESPLKTGGPNDSPVAKFSTAQERAAAAEVIFKEVREKWGRSDAADVANLYLGQIEAERGDYVAARPRFEEFIKDHPKHLLADNARLGLYHIRIASGSVNEVVADIQAELGTAEKSLPNDVLLGLLAQAYEMQGENQKARDTWQRIANEFPDSPYGFEAQRKLVQG